MIIYLAVQNGWEEKDLIKICLPKWDKINEFKKRNITTNKSIFFFFTWRVWNKNITDEMKIKSIYFQNIIELINNKILNEFLNKKGITINFCLHHMLEIFVNKLNLRNRKIKYIKQNEIFQNIMKSSLLVTDFSSIIFEFIYQKKPYIMYIPDSEDPNIDIFYDKDYFNLIKRLKDGSVFFMNKYFSINHVVDKIIYYIFIMISFIQPFILNKKSNLRKLDWEDEVKFNTDTDSEEVESIGHCEKNYYTDYKYNIFYEVGKDNYEFPETNLVDENDYYAVSNIFKREKYKIN